LRYFPRKRCVSQAPPLERRTDKSLSARRAELRLTDGYARPLACTGEMPLRAMRLAKFSAVVCTRSVKVTYFYSPTFPNPNVREYVHFRARGEFLHETAT